MIECLKSTDLMSFCIRLDSGHAQHPLSLDVAGGLAQISRSEPSLVGPQGREVCVRVCACVCVSATWSFMDACVGVWTLCNLCDYW